MGDTGGAGTGPGGDSGTGPGRFDHWMSRLWLIGVPRATGPINPDPDPNPEPKFGWFATNPVVDPFPGDSGTDQPAELVAA